MCVEYADLCVRIGLPTTLSAEEMYPEHVLHLGNAYVNGAIAFEAGNINMEEFAYGLAREVQLCRLDLVYKDPSLARSDVDMFRELL